jgi:hypothetical protein
MYYQYPCPYCGKVFFTHNTNKEQAAEILFHGIKKHQAEYGEDEREHTMDEGEHHEVNQMYQAITGTTEAPSGGYEL